MSDQTKHGGQPVAVPALLKMPKPKHLRRQMRKDGGYDMVPAYTVDEMQEYARAIAAAESTQPQRECSCGWIGNQDDCAWCGSVGPLCPKCHETTEVSQQPAIAQPVAVPDWLTWELLRDQLVAFVDGALQNPATLSPDQLADSMDRLSAKPRLYNALAQVRAMLSAAQKGGAA